MLIEQRSTLVFAAVVFKCHSELSGRLPKPLPRVMALNSDTAALLVKAPGFKGCRNKCGWP